MKVLWALERATVAEVRDEHNRRYGTDLAYTTVMTLLGRLAGKRAVKVDKSRQQYLYRPAFQRESVLRDRLRQFIDTVFDGKPEALVLRLVEDESLSLAELRDIERSIEERPERDRPVSSAGDPHDDIAGDPHGDADEEVEP